MAEEDSGLDKELYGDEPKSDESDRSESKSEETVDEKASENLKALLPLSALGGKAKSGDKITMRVVKVHGDSEVEVEISESSDSESKDKDEDDEMKELEELEV